MRAAASNPTVAREIGLTYTAVSRLRSGARVPSVSTMLMIQEIFGWPCQEQMDARGSGTFHLAFEAMLIEKYGKELDSVSA